MRVSAAIGSQSGRQFQQVRDEAPGNADRAGRGMIEVEPLETCGDPGLNRLHQDRMAKVEQRPGLVRRNQQSFREGQQLVAGRDQAGQRARPGDDMEPGARRFGRVLERYHLGRDLSRQADDALAIHRQGKPQLVARKRYAADAEESSRHRRAGTGGLDHGQ